MHHGGKRYKLADGEFIHGDYLSTSEVVVQQPSTPSGNSGNGGNTNTDTGYTMTSPFTGQRKGPGEGVTKVSEEERFVNARGQEILGYWIETEGGKFWYDERYGEAFRSIEDAINRKHQCTGDEVFPSRQVDYSDIHVS